MSFEAILSEEKNSKVDDRGVKGESSKWYLQRLRADSLDQIQQDEKRKKEDADRQLAEDLFLAEQLEIESQIEAERTKKAPQKAPQKAQQNQGKPPRQNQRRRGNSSET